MMMLAAAIPKLRCLSLRHRRRSFPA
jgi:hypothetical protein